MYFDFEGRLQSVYIELHCLREEQIAHGVLAKKTKTAPFP